MGFLAPFASLIAGGIGGLLGGRGGGGGGAAQGLASNVTNQQLGMQKGLFDLYRPFAQSGGNYFSNLLGSSQQQQSAVAPAAENISRAYGGTQQGIQNYLPMGGERNLALANLQTQRAGDISRLYAGVQPQAAQTLLQGGIAGTGSAASFGFPAAIGASGLLNYATNQNALSQQSGAGFGQGIGSLLASSPGWGGGRGGCWIFTALFGKGTLKTKMCWAWLTNPEHGWAARSVVGRIVTRLYYLFGKRIAQLIETNRVVERVCRFFGDWVWEHRVVPHFGLSVGKVE